MIHIKPIQISKMNAHHVPFRKIVAEIRPEMD